MSNFSVKKNLEDNYDWSHSVGVVQHQDLNFAIDEPMQLECGAVLSNLTLRYETYGQLNEDKSNAILVEHSLTGTHHAAGKYSGEDSFVGWWDGLIGPWKAIDTNKYFVICSNCLGGCSGTTGPGSINPITGKTYNLDFPVITIGDMVTAQLYLMKYLSIRQFYSIIGSSMGGMEALYWSVHHPDKVRSVICLATTAAQSAQSIAFSEVGRRSIISDVKWNNGNYLANDVPKSGLSVARMLAPYHLFIRHFYERKIWSSFTK